MIFLLCATVLLSLLLVFPIQCEYTYSGKCPAYHGKHYESLKILQHLDGKRFKYDSVTEDAEETNYRYYLGICTHAVKQNEKFKETGLVQVKLDKKGKPMDGTEKDLGKFTSTDYSSGEDWFQITYGNGDRYGSHCDNNPRRSHIMVVCDEGQKDGQFYLHAENKHDDETNASNCYYQFILKHNSACPVKITKLSAGSIICIVFLCLVTVYIVGGLLIMRFVKGAQGWEQVPNYTFWRAVGNYSADGCDLVFRSEKASESSRQYRGVTGGDDMEQEIPRNTHQPDDHLLSM